MAARRRSRILALGMALAQVAAGMTGAPAGAAAPIAPDFAVRLLDGGVVERDALRGRLVVLNYWATWCVPCRQELRDMDRVARAHPDKVAVFAINVDRALPPARLRPFAQDLHLSIATGLARGADAYPLLRSGVPTTYVLAADGRLALARAGAFADGEFACLADAMLAVTSAASSARSSSAPCSPAPRRPASAAGSGSSPSPSR